MRSTAFESGGLLLLLVSRAFAIIFFNNRSIFIEVFFIPLVVSAGLLILRSLAQNIDGLLVLVLEQGSSEFLLLWRGGSKGVKVAGLGLGVLWLVLIRNTTAGTRYTQLNGSGFQAVKD